MESFVSYKIFFKILNKGLLVEDEMTLFLDVCLLMDIAWNICETLKKWQHDFAVLPLSVFEVLGDSWSSRELPCASLSWLGLWTGFIVHPFAW